LRVGRPSRTAGTALMRLQGRAASYSRVARLGSDPSRRTQHCDR
jgi:hypothetical protein